MDGTIYVLVASLAGVAVGGGFTWVVFNNILKNKKEGILAEATKEGETIKEKKILQAKEKFLEMKNQHENEVRERNKRLQQGEDKIKSRERDLSQQVEQYGVRRCGSGHGARWERLHLRIEVHSLAGWISYGRGRTRRRRLGPVCLVA